MSKNTNILQKTTDNLSNASQQVGMMLMTAAALTGMLELPSHTNSRVVLPGQATLVLAEENEETNPIRREKEESAPHYVSYSISQRTPGRTGRR